MTPIQQLVLAIVRQIVDDKRRLGVSPDFAIGREIYARIHSSLEELADAGQLVRRRVSVNAVTAYQLPDK